MAGSTSSEFSSAELKKIRADLVAEADSMRQDIERTHSDIEGLIQDSGEGSGDDLADAGSKTYAREQEMQVTVQVREALHQVERAIARINDGTYGLCQRCGKPIPKQRLAAFPQATLCVACKSATGG